MRLLAVCRVGGSSCALATREWGDFAYFFMAHRGLANCHDFAASTALASRGWSLDRLGFLGWRFVRFLRRSGKGAGSLGLGGHLRSLVCSGPCLVGRRASARLGHRIVEHCPIGGLFFGQGLGGLFFWQRRRR